MRYNWTGPFGTQACGCERHSIDNVTGRPIEEIEFVIPVYKGSTLISEFQFPFDISSGFDFAIVDTVPEELEIATINVLDANTISVRWESDVINSLSEDQENSFRVSVINTNDDTVFNFNKIEIQVV